MLLMSTSSSCSYTWYVPYNYITEDGVLSNQPQLTMESTSKLYASFLGE